MKSMIHIRPLLTGLLAVLSLLPLQLSAQRLRGKAKPKVVEPVENPRFASLLPGTAKVVVVDSVVVDSVELLKAVCVNPEEGLLTTYRQFFQEQGEGIVCQNELGNKCIFSMVVDRLGHRRLFQSDKVGRKWTEPQELPGLDDDGRFSDMDYPYLMPDGVTLYFAARGEESVGGLDIYRTRFDVGQGRFLKPENLGLPFNSEADDYLFVVDEQNQLAYFASGRNQQPGKVCVYTFIPFENRSVLDADVLSPERLRSLARLDRIADTWGSGTARKQALMRKQSVKSLQAAHALAQPEFRFVVNDRTTYTRMADFRQAENRERMEQLLSLQKQTEVLSASLDVARNYYATATLQKRQLLSVEILDGEWQLEQLAKEIHSLEKQIRNTENQ